MRSSGVEPELPDNLAPHLTEWLFEIGPTVPGGMGATVIGWRDLEAWQTIMGIELSPWEARLLRKLSGVYLMQAAASEKPECPAPYLTQNQIIRNRQAVDRQMDALRSAARGI